MLALNEKEYALDPSVTTERLARTDARVIVCGHTHLPEVRDLGWKLVVNDGFDRLQTLAAIRHRRRVAIEHGK